MEKNSQLFDKARIQPTFFATLWSVPFLSNFPNSIWAKFLLKLVKAEVTYYRKSPFCKFFDGWWIWRRSFCKRNVPLQRGSNPQPSDNCWWWVPYWLSYCLSVIYQCKITSSDLKYLRPQKSGLSSLFHTWFWRYICGLYTIEMICLYLLQFHQPSKNLQNGRLPVIGNLIFYRF